MPWEVRFLAISFLLNSQSQVNFVTHEIKPIYGLHRYLYCLVGRPDECTSINESNQTRQQHETCQVTKILLHCKYLIKNVTVPSPDSDETLNNNSNIIPLLLIL